MASSPVLKLTAALLLALLGGGPSADAETLRGPLQLRHVHPLLTGFHTATIAWLPGAPAGAFRFQHGSTGANTYLYDPRLLYDTFTAIVDTASYLGSVSAAFQPVPALSGRLTVDYVALSGGIADPLIETHHELFKLPNAGRELRPQYESRVLLAYEDQVWLDQEGPVAALSRLAVEARWRSIRRFRGNGAVAAGLQGLVSLPLSRQALPLGSGSVDTGVTGIIQLENQPWEVYGNLGWLHYGAPRTAEGIPLRQNALRYGLAWVWAVVPRFALQVQILGQTSPLDFDHPRLGGHMSIAGFGLSYHPSERLSVSAAFVEEFFTYAAVDVALHLGLQIRGGGP